MTRPREEWKHDVAGRYKALEKFSKEDARLQFLRILRSLPYGTFSANDQDPCAPTFLYITPLACKLFETVNITVEGQGYLSPWCGLFCRKLNLLLSQKN